MTMQQSREKKILSENECQSLKKKLNIFLCYVGLS